jgi:hypothetical protein
MSKRSNLYVEIDRNKYQAAAIANGVERQWGVSSGINYMF